MSRGNGRRAALRHELTQEVSIESRHKSYRGVTHDVSAGGFFVATSELRPIGDCIRLRFTLPGSPESFDAMAEVRWLRRKETVEGVVGMGLQFIQMSTNTKVAVKAFCVKQETVAFQALCAVLNRDANPEDPDYQPALGLSSKHGGAEDT